MQKLKFTIAACSQTKEGKFVWKLHVMHVGDAFGVIKEFKRTYYIGGMPKSIAIGTTLEDTLDKFNVIERPVAIITDATYTEQNKTMDIDAAQKLGKQHKVVKLSWLHLKPSALTQKAA